MATIGETVIKASQVTITTAASIDAVWSAVERRFPEMDRSFVERFNPDHPQLR